MDWQPLRDAGLAVQVHVGFALAAIALGAVVVARPKGGAAHRLTGRLWALCLGATALSAFAIHGVRMVGPFSPLHALSVAVLAALWSAVRAARRGDLAAHARTMRVLYFGSLVGTAAFALMPNRTLSRVLFGSVESPGWERHGWLLALAFGAILVAWPGPRGRRRQDEKMPAPPR